MAETRGHLQDLVGTVTQRNRLARDDQVELHLDSGQIVDVTVTSIKSKSATAGSITARRKTWTRWSGTTDDLLAFVRKAYAEIAERSSEQPPVDIRLSLGADDEERYFDLKTFEHEIKSMEKGTPGSRLRELQVINISIGPSEHLALKVEAVFSRALAGSGVGLAVESADRGLASGLKEELAPMIAGGTPRIPALPGPVQMFVGGIAGFAYFVALDSVDWDFMPGGFLGALLFALMYLVGFIGLIYAVTFGIRSLLPPLTLVQAGQTTSAQQWVRRSLKIAGSLVAAVLPFVLEKIFE